MTISNNYSGWERSFFVLAGYLTLGILAGIGGHKGLLHETWIYLPVPPRIEIILNHSMQISGASYYWMAMVYFFIPAFLFFCFFSPIKITKNNISVLFFILYFLFFDVLVSPYAVWRVLFDANPPAGSRFEIMLESSTRNFYSMIAVGSYVFSGLIFLCWLSYFQFPRAFLMIKKTNGKN